MALNVAQLMNVPGGPGIVGAVKSGAGIEITGEGIVNLKPPAGATLGGVKAGNNITITSDGTISAAGGAVSLSPGNGITMSPNPITGTGVISNSGVLQISSSSVGYSFTPAAGNVVFSAVGGVITDYDPIVLIAGGQWAYSGGGGSSGSLGNVQIPIPPGADRVALWTRCRMEIFCLRDGDPINNGVAWAEGTYYQMTASGATFDTSNPLAALPEQSCVLKASRGNGAFATRFDLLSVPGTGNRTITLNVTAGCSDSGRDNYSQATVQLFQLIALPYTNG